MAYQPFKYNFSLKLQALTLVLVSTMTNLVPAGAILSTRVQVSNFRVVLPALWYITLTFIIYFIVSAIAVDPKQLLTYDFWRRDGNIVVSLSPIILLPLYKRTSYEYFEKSFKSFLILTSVISLPLLFYFLVASEKSSFRGLFISHNAAGGFYAVLFCYAWCLRKSNRFGFFICAIIGACLFATDSRGSILALLGALIAIRFKISIKIILLVSLLLSIGFGILTIDKWKSLGEPRVGKTVPNIELEINRSGTLINRVFFLYPRAYDLFQRSPLVGIGSGTYNDYFTLKDGFLFSSPQQLTVISSSEHAHNSYLHIMAENGLIGLFLMLLTISSISRCGETSGFHAFKLIAAYIALVSITEHRFTTPSQMWVITFPLAAYLSNVEIRKAR